MFERFTQPARRIMIDAQEEARTLNHGSIGTEHLLLGLLHDGGIGGRSLREVGFTLDDVRARVSASARPAGSPKKAAPFTPRAKNVLEYALRRALRLGHNYIGTEHIALALTDVHQGLAWEIIGERAAEIEAAVNEHLDESSDEPQVDTPLCTSCRAPLDSSLGYQVLMASPPHGVDGYPVAVVFCRACGRALGVLPSP